MNTKEIKITPPEGYEIDVLNSNLECIKFKPIEKKRWRDDENACVEGYYIDSIGNIKNVSLEDNQRNIKDNYNIFVTEKQAKSALAMARISQIMANDKRFGGVITDEEWKYNSRKYVIKRKDNQIYKSDYNSYWMLLTFHTVEQRDLFLEENEDLVRDYLMID